jgi:hypothetical protein
VIVANYEKMGSSAEFVGRKVVRAYLLKEDFQFF